VIFLDSSVVVLRAQGEDIELATYDKRFADAAQALGIARVAV
jgi:hypothetical protein